MRLFRSVGLALVGLLVLAGSAFAQTPEPVTVSSLVTEVTGAVDGVVPDLAVYIGAAVVIGLVAYAGRRLIKLGR